MLTLAQLRKLEVGTQLKSNNGEVAKITKKEMNANDKIDWLELDNYDFFTESDKDRSFLKWWSEDK